MRFMSILLGIVGLDQLLKLLVRSFLPLGGSIPVIHPILYLSYVRNEGAAFGLFQGMTPVFILSAVVVVIGALVYTMALRPPAIVISALALIAGGAAGNLIDRVVHNGVIDYIDLKIWPVFNLADIAIVTGSLLVMIFITFGSREEEQRAWK